MHLVNLPLLEAMTMEDLTLRVVLIRKGFDELDLADLACLRVRCGAHVVIFL